MTNKKKRDYTKKTIQQISLTKKKNFINQKKKKKIK